MVSSESTAAPTTQSVAPSLETPHIVVAEDDFEMCRLVVEALRKDGYDVTAVGDGKQLLAALALEGGERTDGGRADLVVSDVRMPQCSGMAVLERLRAAGQGMPVILMTAFGDAACRDRARSLGAVLFDKPFELDELRAAVAALLRRDAPLRRELRRDR